VPSRPKYRADREAGLDILIDRAGSMTEIAAACAVTRSAVSNWRRVPWQHVLKLEAAFDIPRHELRPDIYPPPRRRA